MTMASTEDRPDVAHRSEPGFNDDRVDGFACAGIDISAACDELKVRACQQSDLRRSLQTHETAGAQGE